MKNQTSRPSLETYQVGELRKCSLGEQTSGRKSVQSQLEIRLTRVCLIYPLVQNSGGECISLLGLL